MKIPKKIRSDFLGEKGVAHWGGVPLDSHESSSPFSRKPQLLELTSVFKKKNNIRQQGMAPLGVGLLCFMVSEKRYNLPLQKIQFWCGFKLMVVSETSLIVMSRGHIYDQMVATHMVLTFHHENFGEDEPKPI